MPTYAAFLRAINLGPTRKFPNDAIKSAARSAGFEDVATYINTGNLRVATARRSPRSVERALEEAFAADRGFEVPTVALTLPQLAEVVAEADRFAEEVPVGVQYVSLLKEAAGSEVARALEGLGLPGEHARVSGRAVHIVLEKRDGYHQATLTNALVEKRAGVATNRNLRVLRELVSRWV